MKSSELIFTSYCFGDKYLDQQIRLRESIRDIYKDARIYFQNEPEETGKPKFQQSLYGFKVNLIRQCLKMDFKKIVFFDTAICLNTPVDHWFDIIKDYGVLAPVDRQTLNNVTSDRCLKHLNLTRDQVSKWNLVGGSIYVFDFDLPLCNKIFNMWDSLEKAGMFGTQDDLSADKLQGHRMDETCMALSLALNGVLPLGHDEIRYCYEHPETKKIHTMGDGSYTPIAIKRHFK